MSNIPMTRIRSRPDTLITPFTVEPFTINKDDIDPEYRKYLLLLDYYDQGSSIDRRYEIIEGRLEVYKFLRDNIEFYDPNTSKVMTETTPLDKSITIVQFMRYVFDNNLGEEDDGFDIREYENEKPVEEVEKEIKEAQQDMDYGDLLDYCKKIIN